MKDLYLIDQVENKVVFTSRKAEDAVKWLGHYMTLTGVDNSFGRFILVHKPSKSGKSLIEYQPDELSRRALVYVDQTTMNKRMQKTQKGKWAQF